MYQRFQRHFRRRPLHSAGRLISCSPIIFLWRLIIISGLASCTAHYSVNDAVESTESVQRYSLLKETISNRSDELIVYLAFSGGGTRAAAFSYGVLQKLAETNITVNDQPRRFIDEVDVISSVSGGSFTAAYYGLFGEKIFEARVEGERHHYHETILRYVQEAPDDIFSGKLIDMNLMK